MIWTVPKIWEDDTVFILGGGPSLPRQFHIPEDVILSVMKGTSDPSAYSDFLAPIHDKHVIGVNSAFKIGNWIDVLYFGDSNFYVIYRMVLPQISMLKITSTDRFANYNEKQAQGIKYLMRDKKKPYGINPDPTKICWNNNSGAAAINLAVHFGAKRIVLLGYDMSLDNNKTSHWFGSYNRKAVKPVIPPFAHHMKGFDAIKRDADNLGVEILNCSNQSALNQFRKVSLEEILSEINHEISNPEGFQQCSS